MIMRDGIEVPINKREYETIVPKIRMTANMKMYKNPEGHFIVLTPSNLQMIKFYGEEPEVEETEEKPQAVKKSEIIPEQKELKESKPKDKISPEERAKIIAEVEGKNFVKDVHPTIGEEELEKDPLAEMIEKSNCKHEVEKLELYRQHTAKGIRYFPVCSFCGKRERYVSESKIVKGKYVGTPHEHWVESDITNAKAWID